MYASGYMVLVMEAEDRNSWIAAGKGLYPLEEKSAAYKKYAMRLEDYGKMNVCLVKIVPPTCIAVEVLVDGETYSSK